MNPIGDFFVNLFSGESSNWRRFKRKLAIRWYGTWCRRLVRCRVCGVVSSRALLTITPYLPNCMHHIEDTWAANAKRRAQHRKDMGRTYNDRTEDEALEFGRLNRCLHFIPCQTGLIENPFYRAPKAPPVPQGPPNRLISESGTSRLDVKR